MSKNYMTVKQIQRDVKNSGLSYEEYLEMAYEDLSEHAKHLEKKLEKVKKALQR